ncbi:MAG: TatD family hydrolase [Candidatus Gracilibacteria bacterium]
MWIDTHCHPFSESYENPAQVVRRAEKAGVGKIISVGYTKEANRLTLEMAEKFPSIFAVLGIHPSECDDLSDEEISWMREKSKSPKVVAIGEIGLDYFRNKFSPEKQEEVFRKQIRLAKELALPCVIHSRDSGEETLKILIDEKLEKAVFHCYSYDLDFARKVWERGYYTSFTGIVTYPKADGLRDVVKAVPEDLFFVETDCPYLPPQSKRGQVNEMAYIVEIYEKIAELRGVSAEELAKTCEKNVKQSFGI